MKSETIRQRIHTALEGLTADLKEGRAESLEAYLRALARFRDYSLRNVTLIVSQMPDATYVAGYRAWQELGRQVRKGEKGIVITAPVVGRKSCPEDDSPGSSDDMPEVRGFRGVYVFDISQTEGEELPSIARPEGDPVGVTDRLRAFIVTQGISIVEDDGAELGHSLGRSKGGCILIRCGLPAAEEFSVLAHELAHELLHHDPATPRPAKSVRETEAEAVAFLVSESVGLKCRLAARDYIQLHDGNAETLFQSFGRIKAVAGEIVAGLLSDHSTAEAA